MQSILRITLLMTCLAVGIAVAVAVALRTPPQKPAANASAPEVNPVSTGPAFESQSLPLPYQAANPNYTPAPYEPIFEPLQPAIAPYHAAVAQQIETPPALDQPAAPAPAPASPAAPPPPAADDPFRDDQAPAAPQPPVPTPPAPAAELPPEEIRVAPQGIVRDEGDDKLHITLQDSDIRDVLKQLADEGGFNVLATKSVAGNVTAQLAGMDVETALAAILKSTGYIARREGNILYVGTPGDFDQIDQTQDVIHTRIYRPNYVKAADLQTLMTPLLTPQIGKITVNAPAEVDIPADQVKTGGNNFADVDVVMVRDFETVLKQMDEIFAEVDVKPRQVAIEAMILSVNLSDEYKMGVSWELFLDKDNVRLLGGTPIPNLNLINPLEGGLKFGYLDQSLFLFIDALESIGDTNVVAAPRLTVLNKQRAEIQIGQELGYVSTTVTDNSAVQTVNFLDVGTLLRIRPFIGNDGMIRLEVHPELSTGTVNVEQNMSLPNKTVTQVTTNVMCPDGCTVVIGGLIREDLATDTTQIPLLGNLPWVGPAFRKKTENVDRTEIIVVITPRIISDEKNIAEGLQYGNEFTQRQSVYFDKMSPIAKRNYALHHLRKARAAFAAADYNTALQQVNLAIHYDPLSRDAIVLRNEIIVAGGYEDESIHEYLNRGLAPVPGGGHDYSKQGYPWKEFEGFTPPDHTITDDPGEPGPSRTLDEFFPEPPVIR
jgi:type IV pilus assembly protein PilQ